MNEKDRSMVKFRAGMREYLAHHEYGSIRQFAMLKGLDVQRMTMYMKKGNKVAPGLDIITSLKESCLDLNMNWLLTGVGEMIIKK